MYLPPKSPRYGVGNTFFDVMLLSADTYDLCCVYLFSLTTPPNFIPSCVLTKAGHALRVNATPSTTHERRDRCTIYLRTNDAKNPS